MHRPRAGALACGLILALAAFAGGACRAAELREETLRFGPFGAVHLLRPAGEPRHVLLFISGDGGWTPGAAAMARAMASGDALLIGVDVETYRAQSAKTRGGCVYAAADLEGLSKYVQLKLGLPRYQPPVLVGYSSGASLAYAALAQAPPNTFRGALSLGFCPSLEFPRPLCKGAGFAAHAGPRRGPLTDWIFEPVAHLSQDWIAFTGDKDEVCTPQGVLDFIHRVPHGIYQEIPGAGHGYSNPALWVPGFRAALSRLELDARASAPRASAPAVADLPLIEVPAVQVPAKEGAATQASPGNSGRFAVMLSGDGGWAGLDREVAGALAARGIPVVGWSSLDYFWRARTPDGGGQDLARVLRHYLAAWKRDRVLLIGYSLGADVLPFFASRLPPDLLAHVELVALLGPSRSTAFEFHLTDWIGGSAADSRPVLPEVHKLAGRPLLCLYGKEEDDSLCPLLRQPGAQSVAFSGAHHFGGSYEAVADRILAPLRTAP